MARRAFFSSAQKRTGAARAARAESRSGLEAAGLQPAPALDVALIDVPEAARRLGYIRENIIQPRSVLFGEKELLDREHIGPYCVLSKEMSLTPEQLLALRSVPLGTQPNKVRLARTMLNLRQADMARALRMTAPELSDLELGKYKDIALEKCRRVTEYLLGPDGAIEDLFPPRVAEGDGHADLERHLGEDRRASQPADPAPVVGA